MFVSTRLLKVANSRSLILQHTQKNGRGGGGGGGGGGSLKLQNL